MNEKKLSVAIQGLINKGLIYCTLELKNGELVEVYKILPQPKNVRYICAECRTPLTKNYYCPICEAGDVF